MNTRLLFLTVAGALALAACGNKGPLVKASKPDPEADTPAVDTPKGDVPVEIIDDTPVAKPAAAGNGAAPADAAGSNGVDDGPPDTATLPTTGG